METNNGFFFLIIHDSLEKVSFDFTLYLLVFLRDPLTSKLLKISVQSNGHLCELKDDIFILRD